MNDFSNIDNSQGLLKTIYDPEKLKEEALKRKRRKLAESILGTDDEEENKEE